MTQPSSVLEAPFLRIAGKQLVRFEGDEVVIGRGDTAKVVVADQSISREHCRIRRAEDGFLIKDLGSANGTFVNGKKIEEEVPVLLGDRIRVGAVDVDLCTETSMGASLRIISAAHRGAEFSVRGERTLIGRKNGPADVPIEDDNASREHCRISCQTGIYFVHDLGSRNGTLLNGKKLGAETRLANGDLIQIGRTVLEFRAQQLPPAEPGTGTISSNAPTDYAIKTSVETSRIEDEKPHTTKQIARPSRFRAFAAGLGMEPTVVAYLLGAIVLGIVIASIIAALD